MNCWDTSGITDMQGAFFGSAFYDDFNEPLEYWDTSNVTDMSYMFYFADKFNQDINRWNTSQVTCMRSMFYETESLDQNFEDWDIAKVTHMGWMFDLTKEGATCPSWAANVGGTLAEEKGVTTGVSAEDDSYVRGNCEHPPESAAATRTKTGISSVMASIVAATVMSHEYSS
jgi:surface protein